MVRYGYGEYGEIHDTPGYSTADIYSHWPLAAGSTGYMRYTTITHS